MSFVFPGIKAFMIMGIAEIVAGAFILLGLLRTNRGFLARLLGGITLIAFGILFVTMRSVGGIHIDEGRMHLEAPFMKDKVITSGDIRSVREIDIFETQGMKPVRKISGGNVGDVRTGWFKLSSGQKAYLMLEGRRALYIETGLGFDAIVGTYDFDAFEAAFRGHVYVP
jgi:drug/metabolite transporter superfamily protein YnfA